MIPKLGMLPQSPAVFTELALPYARYNRYATSELALGLFWLCLGVVSPLVGRGGRRGGGGRRGEGGWWREEGREGLRVGEG